MKAYQAHQVLMLESYLDRHDELLKASRATYNLYQGDRVEDLPFQRKLVKHAISQPKTWTAELATGIGKSVIGARIALERVHDGPVIYVCPSAAALGDRQSGIVNKFMRTFKSFGKPNLELGALNDLSRANDVSFMTPRALAHLLSKDRQRASEIMKRASCFIVDEAHHFPNDAKDELKIYGAIYDAAEYLVRDGLTVAMTGTWERLDRMQVMGRATPDARLTVQDAVDLGRCPAIYGVQVVTDVVATKVSSRADLYDMHLAPKERQKYLDGVVACMHTVYKRYPVPFAAFARTRADAAVLVERFNKASRLGDRGIALLTGEVPMHERLRIVEEITSGKKAGYVTCAVGEEALDMPVLEVVHLVRRTRSHVRNMQAIGRALRTREGKRRALIVDYQTMLSGVTDRFLGLTLEDMAERQDSRTKELVNGGPMIEQDSYQTCKFGGMTMQEERGIVCVRTETESALSKTELLAQAAEGKPKPTMSLKQPDDARFLAHAFYNYTHSTTNSSGSYDPVFTAKLKALRPDWFISNHDPKGRKAELLRRAKAGEPVPVRSGPDRLLAVALYNYTYKKSNVYSEAFFEELRAVRPDWLTPRRSRTEANKVKLRALAVIAKKKKDECRPQGSLGTLFRNYAVNEASTTYDPKFSAEMRKLWPVWFERSSSTKKAAILSMAHDPARKRPRFHVKDPKEVSLAHMLARYTMPGHRCYDEDFTAKLRAVRPEWIRTRPVPWTV